MSQKTDELVKRYTDKFLALNQGMMELEKSQFNFSKEAFESKMQEVVRLRKRRERMSTFAFAAWFILTISVFVVTVIPNSILDIQAGLGTESGGTVGLTAIYALITKATDISIGKVENEISNILNQLQNSQNKILETVINENSKLQKALDAELKDKKN